MFVFFASLKRLFEKIIECGIYKHDVFLKDNWSIKIR